MAKLNLNEQARLKYLHSFNALDENPDEDLDALTKLLTKICQVPICAISLVDAERQWFKSKQGLSLSETPREISFCHYAIQNDEPYIVADTSLDPLFHNNPLVTGAPHIRAYASMPLISAEGYALGTLCVLDDKPRQFTQDQLAGLKIVAKQVMWYFEFKYQREQYQKKTAELNQIKTDFSVQQDLLEALAKGADKKHILSAAASIIEKTLAESLVSIMVMNKDRTHFEQCFFDSAPAYAKQLVNVPVAKDTGSCGAAAYLKKVVITSDIANDAHWENYKELALAHGLRACWSVPIFDSSNEVLATFAIYSRVVNRPSKQDIALVKNYSSIVGLAIERDQYQQYLQLLEACVQNQSDVVLITEVEPIDLPGPKVVFANKAFERVTGYTMDEIIGKTPRILQGADTDKNELNRISSSLKKFQPIRTELLNYKKNGDSFFQELEIMPIANQTGWFTHFIGVGRDITERKKYDVEINHAAFYDGLTGLPNRRLLMDRLSQTLIAKARNQLYGALMFLDLDNFKELNDSVGHAVGDKVLAEVANRLQAVVRKEDTVARMGGDEFVVVLKEIDEVEDLAFLYARQLAEKIQTAFNQPFVQGNEKYFMTCSIGITLFNHNLGSAEDILKHADLAMYQAKADGRNEIVFFELAMQTAMTTRAASIQQLREALDKKQFSLHYQAQLNAKNQMTGAEVLLRWVNDLQESVAPNVFIKLAEESGLIVQIGEWVLRTACQQLTVWQQQAAFKDLKISVNVSVKQFMRSDFVATVLRVLKETGANPHLLTLELTESMFVEDVEKIIAKMSQLKAKGVQLALDDFGVGYSSFMHLRRLPLSEIKIDQSFVRGITDNKVDFVITRAVIELAKNLNISVIAEGVETVAQYEILHAYGCHNYQGYLFGRPVPLAQFEAQLINHK